MRMKVRRGKWKICQTMEERHQRQESQERGPKEKEHIRGAKEADQKEDVTIAEANIMPGNARKKVAKRKAKEDTWDRHSGSHRTQDFEEHNGAIGDPAIQMVHGAERERPRA